MAHTERLPRGLHHHPLPYMPTTRRETPHPSHSRPAFATQMVLAQDAQRVYSEQQLLRRFPDTPLGGDGHPTVWGEEAPRGSPAETTRDVGPTWSSLLEGAYFGDEGPMHVE